MTKSSIFCLRIISSKIQFFLWAVGFWDTDSISRTKKVREKLKRQKSRQIGWVQFLLSWFFSIECDFQLVSSIFVLGPSIVDVIYISLLFPIKKVREITWNIMNARKLFSRIFYLAIHKANQVKMLCISIAILLGTWWFFLKYIYIYASLIFQPKQGAEIGWFSSQDISYFKAKITSWNPLIF